MRATKRKFIAVASATLVAVSGTISLNSASAAINKWIKTVAGPNDVVHGLRHSFRDRLRAVEAPTDMIDQLGGWALKSVGQGYGDGYDLELLVKYLGRLAIDRKIKNISLPTSI